MDLSSSENSTGSSISIMEYVYIIWHWAWLIALITIVTAGSIYWISSHQTPIYEATTELLVSDPPATQSVSSSSLVAATSNSAITYSEMITDTPVLDSVIKSLGLTIATKTLQDAITVSIVPNTQIISVSVDDPSPKNAANIANTIVAEFQAEIQKIQAARYQSSKDSRQKLINSLTAQLSNETDPAKRADIQKSIDAAQTSFDQVVLAEAQSSTIVLQVQPAELPIVPIGPRTFLNTLLAAVIAAMVSVGGILVADFLDDTIRNPDEITTKFGIPVLGVITRHVSTDGRPITLVEPRNPISESFRSLRTNIQYASVDHPIKSLIVTSATPKDGKTTIAINLSVVLAQGGKKVTLIDADMRRPQIHQRLMLPNTSGLSDLFVNSLDGLNGTLKDTGVENLSAITSGRIPPNPSELLSSQKMNQILDKVHEKHDIVLIDTPPVLSVTDAAALSTMVDGILLVAKPGSTKLAAFKMTVEQLRRVGANILGVVLNEMEARSARYGYYYRQYYDSSYYYIDEKTGEKKKKNKKLDVTAGVKEG
jgi:succinoglycan biosynthesis transport protein ExoP